MKTEFICELCRSRYNTAEEALECEAQGIAEELPIGLIMPYNLHDKDKVYLAIAGNNIIGGHHRDYYYWACRAVGDDSLGKEKCGSDILDKENIKRRDKVNINAPEFLRLLEWLRKEKITPKIVNLDGDIVEI